MSIINWVHSVVCNVGRRCISNRRHLLSHRCWRYPPLFHIHCCVACCSLNALLLSTAVFFLLPTNCWRTTSWEKRNWQLVTDYCTFVQWSVIVCKACCQHLAMSYKLYSTLRQICSTVISIDQFCPSDKKHLRHVITVMYRSSKLKEILPIHTWKV